MKPKRFRLRRQVVPRPTVRIRPESVIVAGRTPVVAATDHAVAAEPCARPAPPSRSTGLERARRLWQDGEWAALAALGHAALQHEHRRELMALLVASGHFQVGQQDLAREFLRLAIDWGCEQRLIAQVLVAGIHNSLGRAAALAEQPNRSLTHFASAIATASPRTPVLAATQARASHQLAQLGLSSGTTPRASDGSSSEAATRASERPVAVTALGSGESSSAGICAVTSHAAAQFIVYRVDEERLRVVRRSLFDLSLHGADLHARGVARVVLAQDAEGHIVLAHDGPDGLLVRRTLAADAPGPWSGPMSLPGRQSAARGLLRLTGGGPGRPLFLAVQAADAGAPLLQLWRLDPGASAWRAILPPSFEALDGEATASLPVAVDVVRSAADRLYALLLEPMSDTGAGLPGVRLRCMHADDSAQPWQALADAPVLATEGVPSDLQLVAAAAGNRLHVLCSWSGSDGPQQALLSLDAGSWRLAPRIDGPRRGAAALLITQDGRPVGLWRDAGGNVIVRHLDLGDGAHSRSSTRLPTDDSPGRAPLMADAEGLRQGRPLAIVIHRLDLSARSAGDPLDCLIEWFELALP